MKHRRLVGLLTAGALMVMGLASAGSAMASTTDSCIELGPGPIGAQACVATTSDNYVDFAQVHVGRYDVGQFTLVCTDRWDNVYVKTGNIGRNGTRSFFTEGLFGLHNLSCTLSVRAVNVVVNRRAAATAILIS